MVRTLSLLALVLATAAAADASSSPEKLDVAVRGQTLTLSLYRPSGPPQGTLVIGSGDVGWVGLAVTVAQDWSSLGYAVVGVNVRQYLAAFTAGSAHVQPPDIPRDYRALVDAARARLVLARPLVLAGVSEGAALAVVAAADPASRDWVDGVITMGLPATAELAWRWTDVGSWITKRDMNEPSLSAFDFVPRVAPVPLYMIQSRKDEYVPAADYQRFAAIAREPARQVLIDAGNHRFTDRRDDLHRAILDGLAWIRERRR
jgi:type IV secretory pathway VirJ component